MKRDALSIEITSTLFDVFAKAGVGMYATAYAISSHVHLSAQDYKNLFGKSEGKTVKAIGPRGSIELFIKEKNATKTRVDISFTDATKIGLKGLRQFSRVRIGIGCELRGSSGEVTLRQGVAAPQRHLHISKADAETYGFAEGQKISAIIKSTQRTVQFDQVLVKVGSEGPPKLHIDEDEARAAALIDGQCATLIRGEDTAMTREEIKLIVEETVKQLLAQYFSNGEGLPELQASLSVQKETTVEGLLLEDDIKSLCEQGFTTIKLAKGCILTPLAKDKALECSIELRYEEV